MITPLIFAIHTGITLCTTPSALIVQDPTPSIAEGGQTRTAEYPLSSGGLVEIQLGSADVFLRGWNESKVRTATSVNSPEWETRASISSVSLTRRGGVRSSPGRVDVWVPTGARVIIHLNAGDLMARSLKGSIDVQTQAGDVEIDSVSGSVEITSAAGNVAVRNAGGSVRANVIAGDIAVHDASGDVRIDGVDGSISLANIRSTVVQVQTISGSILCASDVPRAASWSLSAFAGEVRMRVPRNAGVLFSLETMAGGIRTEIPMTMVPSSNTGAGPLQRRNLKLGDGSARVALKAFSGPVIVQALQR